MENSLFNYIEKYTTPFKLGKPVLTGSGKSGAFDSHAVDCPFVFYHQNQFYMLHVGFDGIGYQTGLAVSDDLIHWSHKGVVLKREENVGWDKVGAAGTWILKATDNIYELPTLKKVDGRYWMAYHSYPEEGYEAGSAEIGLAWCEDDSLLNWHRLPKPVYSWRCGADWEKGGLYKACIIEQDGYYYMFYNAKNLPKGQWIEQTGIAVSKDLTNWKRYDNNPVIKVSESGWDTRFCSDPYIVRDEDKWVMFFFGFNGRHAQDGIAISDNIYEWYKNSEPILHHGEEGDIDQFHAHKPCIIFYNGILYHFYVACRKYRKGDPAKNLWDEFRCITVATSKPLSKIEKAL